MDRIDLIDLKELIRDKTTKEVSEYFNISLLTVLNWKKKGCPYNVIGMPNELGNRTTSRFNFKELSDWYKDYLNNVKWGRPIVRRKLL